MQLIIIIVGALLFAQGSWPMVLGIFVLLFLAMVVNLIVRQESMLYVPCPMPGMQTPADNPDGFQSPKQKGMKFDNIYLKTSDGVKIHAWFIPCSPDAPTLLFCHANAGNMGLRVPNFAAQQANLKANVLAFDYRGFGESEGTPSEEGLIEDALSCWQWLRQAAEEKKIDGKKVFVFGRSLGGAVTIALCHKLQEMGETEVIPQGIILENTFTSISNLVDTLFPYVAFESLKKKFLRLSWKSIDRVQTLKVPILLLSGLRDEIVPACHMRALQASAEQSRICRLTSFPEGMHNDTWEKGGRTYWTCQDQFIKDCLEQ